MANKTLLGSKKCELKTLVCLYLMVIVAFVALRYHLLYYLSATEEQTQADYHDQKMSEIKTQAAFRYQDRRENIRKFCQAQNSVELEVINEDPKWKQQLFFDYKHGLMYCGISKVSSTTWVTNLMQ